MILIPDPELTYKGRILDELLVRLVLRVNTSMMHCNMYYPYKRFNTRLDTIRDGIIDQLRNQIKRSKPDGTISVPYEIAEGHTTNRS